jgi:hypothetical protein
VWGDRFVQRQEPDRGLPLRAVLAVERLQHLLDGLGRPEELIEVRSDRFIERQDQTAGFFCSR